MAAILMSNEDTMQINGKSNGHLNRFISTTYYIGIICYKRYCRHVIEKYWYVQCE